MRRRTHDGLNTELLVQLTLALLVTILAVALVAISTLAQGTVLRVEDSPDSITKVHTKVRHTTVIVLPRTESILDFVVGDAEFWDLTGAGHVAFLKPLQEDVHTNIALVCESGRIFSFLVGEGDADPHLVVRIEAEPTDTARPTAHRPAFVARNQVEAYQAMANQAANDARGVREIARKQVEAAGRAAQKEIDAFRADYPTRLQFPYRLEKKAGEWPFLVSSMWHDGRFTYVRSAAQESPALYEVKDGKPSLVAYDLTESGLFIARHVLGEGWLKIGKKRAKWKLAPGGPRP